MDATPGASFLLLGALLALAGLVLMIWAAVHAATRPASAFEAVGQSRVLWLALVIGGFFLQPLGFLSAVAYLVWARPKVDRAVAGV